jgi:tetratricopeptide (TPR) repeat protein
VLALLSLADLYGKQLRNHDAAVESHKKALQIDPANGRALAALVALYTEKQDFASLIKLYEQALKVRQRTDSELPTVLEIGRLYFHKLKNFEQAGEYYQRVRKVDPAHARDARLLSRRFMAARGRASRRRTIAASCWRS